MSTQEKIISEKQLHILQHSLGIDQYGRGRQYRNHFVTGEGSNDHADCVALVEAWLMTHRKGNSITGGSDVFNVTPAGVTYVAEHSPQPQKISRSKQRYKRFLEYGDSFDSFLDFCRWDAHPARSWNGASNKPSGAGGVAHGHLQGM